MEFIDSNSPSFVALAIAIISTVIAALAYRQNTSFEQLRRRRDDAMRAVAARASILFVQYMTLFQSEGLDRTKAGSNEFVRNSLKENAARLEESLDQAISLGLFEKLAVRNEHALPIFTAFQQSLVHARNAGSDQEILSDHLLLGLAITIDNCRRYNSNILKGLLKKEDIAQIRNLLKEVPGKYNID